jgi:hypothetical protein
MAHTNRYARLSIAGAALLAAGACSAPVPTASEPTRAVLSATAQDSATLQAASDTTGRGPGGIIGGH